MLLAGLNCGITLLLVSGTLAGGESHLRTNDWVAQNTSIYDPFAQRAYADDGGDPALQSGLQLIVQSGSLWISTVFDMGGYAVPCTARSKDCTTVTGFPSITAFVSEIDWVPVTSPAGECFCGEAQDSRSPQVDFINHSGKWQIILSPDLHGECFEYIVCPEIITNMQVQSANTLIFTGEDPSGVYKGNVVVKIRLFFPGQEAIGDDLCPGIASNFDVTIKAGFSSPPKGGTVNACDGTQADISVASYAGITRSGTATEIDPLDGVLTQWLNATGPAGIPQGQPFSVGHYFLVNSHGLTDYAGSLVLEIKLEEVQ